MNKGSWGGNASFTYQIERYLNKKNGSYLLESELPENYSEEDFEAVYVNLNIVGSASYSAGCYSRAPEDCYPDEHELEIESITDDDGNDWYHKLTSFELSNIEDMIISGAKNSGYEPDYEPDYNYYNYP